MNCREMMQISEQLTDYCEENNLPLFELPEEYPLIDFSQSICKRLVLEENNRNSAEQLFSSILDARHLSRESVMAQAGYLNINLEGSFCVAEFAFARKRRSGAENEISDKEQSAEEMFTKEQKVRKIIELQFRSFCGEKLLTLSQTGSILVLVPTRGEKQRKIKETVLRIIERAEKDCQEVLYV